MKRLLLLASMVGLGTIANAQARLALYEEFTGENCGPCAATNPGFDALVLKASNASKIQVIKYQVPIPSAGTILYPQAKVYADARRSYYSVSSAPNGKLDGKTSSPSSGSPGHPANFTQSEIDAEAAIASPFKISVTAAWDATYSNIITNIDVEAVSNYTGTGTVYLRTALVQDVDFCTPPGTNGETHFTKVVRSMYPNATGTLVATSWTSGTKNSYNFTIPAPNYVDKSAKPYIVVWLQDDGDKSIPQSAYSGTLSGVPTDAAQGCTTNGVICISGGSGSLTHNVNLQNKGTTSLSTADIYYKVGTGAWAKYTWTGTLAPGASTSVSMPGVAITAAGNYLVTDSIYSAADQNTGNNVSSSTVRVISKDAVSLPSSYNFESSYGSSYFTYDFDKSGEIIYYTYAVLSSGVSIAHSGNYLGWAQLFGMTSGATAYLVLPTPSLATKPLKLEFWEAYAQQTSSNNDKIELVYSTNCGTSWSSLWSKSGSAHATAAPSVVTTNYWLPASATSSDWQKRSLDLSSLPAGSIMALRVTANGGNNLFIDDINILTGTAISEANLNVDNVNIFPNPANSEANVEFSISQKSNVVVSVVDVMGRVVLNVANQQMNAGTQNVAINTSSLASGVYMVKIDADGKSVTERFSVVK